MFLTLSAFPALRRRHRSLAAKGIFRRTCTRSARVLLVWVPFSISTGLFSTSLLGIHPISMLSSCENYQELHRELCLASYSSCRRTRNADLLDLSRPGISQWYACCWQLLNLRYRNRFSLDVLSWSRLAEIKIIWVSKDDTCFIKIVVNVRIEIYLLYCMTQRRVFSIACNHKAMDSNFSYTCLLPVDKKVLIKLYK